MVDLITDESNLNDICFWFVLIVKAAAVSLAQFDEKVFGYSLLFQVTPPLLRHPRIHSISLTCRPNMNTSFCHTFKRSYAPQNPGDDQYVSGPIGQHIEYAR